MDETVTRADRLFVETADCGLRRAHDVHTRIRHNMTRVAMDTRVYVCAIMTYWATTDTRRT